ncbi:LysR family transcriptional regulator [Pseudoxanthobacter sp.]|uniref:LysR family transcriptional regulator n=1 Tax=Pseudoxanthobacter sp. TaxID=1925742 RepID=UPI002FE28889
MSVSLKQIRYFLAAADSGQISQAAVDLNVSQSAVTAAVQQLEATLGFRLFDRTPVGVVPTVEGSRFVAHARNIIAAVEEAMRVQRSAPAATEGTVRIGLTYTVSGYYLPRHLARFTRSFPNVTLDLYEAQRSVIEQALLDGALDIAVILVSNLGARDRLRYETLVRSVRRLWLPAEHPLLRLPRITLSDVAGERYVMLTVDEAGQTTRRYWAPSTFSPRVIFRTSSVEAVRSMVAAGMGVTILSDLVYRPWSLEGQRLETRMLEDEIPTMDVGLVWRDDVAMSPATAAFRDFLSLAAGGAAPGI